MIKLYVGNPTAASLLGRDAHSHLQSWSLRRQKASLLGLAIFPGDVVEVDLEHRDPAAPWPFEGETLACTLKDPDEVPVEFRARAIATAGPHGSTGAELLRC